MIEDLVIRYAPDLPAVIQGLSVSLLPREKIGVVGRTGEEPTFNGGVRSLISSSHRVGQEYPCDEPPSLRGPFRRTDHVSSLLLVRRSQPGLTSLRNSLDGLDIVSIGLADLRSKVVSA